MDRAGVRLHDLVVTDPAALTKLRQLEIVPILPPHKDDLGREVVTIRGTGMLAASLEKYGMIAGGHRHLPGEMHTETINDTCTWDDHAAIFPRFDDVAGYPSIDREIFGLITGHPGVSVLSLPTSASSSVTVGGRRVWAVRVGPFNTVSGPVPTVYILGAHHAREWATTELVLEMMREYVANATPNNPMGLTNAAVVFVPVVNPDGYELTHVASHPADGWRDLRKNRNTAGCATLHSAGVDINRNYPTAWNQPSDGTSLDPCMDQYAGTGSTTVEGAGGTPNLERETYAIKKLLDGSAWTGEPQRPIATVSYHTYSDDLIYPDPFKATTGTDGPACGLNDSCSTPDFMTYRKMFGDWIAPLLVDSAYPYAGGAFTYEAGQGNQIGYTVSGDTTAYANYGAPTKHVAITPELTGFKVGFYLECETGPTNYTAIMADLKSKNLALLTSALNAASGITSTVGGTSYAQSTGLRYSFHSLMREKVNGTTDLTARPSMLVGYWKTNDTTWPADKAETTSVGTLFLKARRAGAIYNLYSVPAPSAWWQVPTWVGTNPGQQQGGGIKYSVASLCTDNYSHSSNFVFHNNASTDLRGGTRDCWYDLQPNSTITTFLTLPGFTVTDITPSNMRVSFSVEWSPPASGAGALFLEKQVGGTWVKVTSWPLTTPYYETRVGGGRVRSYSFERPIEAGGVVAPMRFRLSPGSNAPGIKLFDIVTSWNYGSLD